MSSCSEGLAAEEDAAATPRRADAALYESAATRDDSLAGRVEQGLATWGVAFLAYLLLPDVNLRDPAMEDRFLDSYTGSFGSRRAFIEGQLERLGWLDALTAFCAQEGIWERALLWDFDALWEHCREVYTTSERLGDLHVFLQ